MAKMDFRNVWPNGDFVVSTVFKVEVAVIFLFSIDISVEGAFSMAVIWACVNQATEVYYRRQHSLLRKLGLLLGQLMLLLCVYLVAWLLHLHLRSESHGQYSPDTAKAWPLMGLLAWVGGLVGVLRLTAAIADYLSNKKSLIKAAAQEEVTH